MIDSIDINVIEKKLMAARTKLILDKPFLGALVLRLPLCHADPAWCPTTATDTKKFYYNPEFFKEHFSNLYYIAIKVISKSFSFI